MKSIYLLLLPFLFILNTCGNPTNNQTPKQTLKIEKTEMKKPTKLLRHVVLFNFNNTATTEVVNKIEQAFADLPSKISAIHSFEWGTNNSPEGLDKGFTHCFLVTFLSEKDRDSYIPHPDHQAFVKMIGPYVEDVTVVDYWVE